MFLAEHPALTCLGFVPLYAGVRLSLERNDANIDLLFVTTITPGAIIRGKYLTAMALTLLIFSACMPFITFTYLLRGIDLPTIFYCLAVGFLVCAAPMRWAFSPAASGQLVHAGHVAVGVVIGLFYRGLDLEHGRAAHRDVRHGRVGERLDFWAGVGVDCPHRDLGDRPAPRPLGGHVQPQALQPDAVPRLYIMACWAIAGIVMRRLVLLPRRSLWPIYALDRSQRHRVFDLGRRWPWASGTRGARGCEEPFPAIRCCGALRSFFYTGSAGGIALVHADVRGHDAGWLTPGIELCNACPSRRVGVFECLQLHGHRLWLCVVLLPDDAALLRHVCSKNVPTTILPVIAAFLGPVCAACRCLSIS